jgi:hypothetical protein
MKAFKRAVMVMVVALACAGVYGALRNLPVASGCAFYGQCPATAGVAAERETDSAENTLSASANVAAP